MLFVEGLIDSFEELKNGLKSSLLSLKYSGNEESQVLQNSTDK